MIRLLPVLALLLAGCAGAGPGRGSPDDRPTVVSLNPCTDAILAEVSEPGQLLAISHYSKDPRASSMDSEDAARFPATGGTVEEVLALDPDVVVASTFLAPATRAALEDLGLRVVTFGGTADVASSIGQIRELAALMRNAGKGEALVEKIELALSEVAGAADPVEAALWQPGGVVPGEASLVSDILRRTGFASYSATRGMGQADYLSLEQVVADPPQVLLVAGSEVGQRHPVLDGINRMARADFDTRLIYCGGPTIIRAARRLKTIRDTVS